MAELKTKKQNSGVDEFLASIPDDGVRQDCRELTDLMRKITGDPGDMWGTSIVGFGEYHYKYASGRENDWFRMGFSPRKQNLTIYIMSGYEDKEDLLAKLGPHSLGKSCLYIKRLADIDMKVLADLLRQAHQTKNYGEA
ncbi:MAG TPA: DUF1801 domain-containing protein [Candidatus Saccharimonadales bacterium]